MALDRPVRLLLCPGRKDLLDFRLTGNVTMRTLLTTLPAAALLVVALIAPAVRAVLVSIVGGVER